MLGPVLSWSKRKQAIAAAVVALAVIAGVAFALTQRGGATEAPAAAPSETGQPGSSETPSGTIATIEPGPEPGAIIATTAVDYLRIFESPEGGIAFTLDEWSDAAYEPLTLLGIGTQTSGGEEWIQVLLPVQPNGTTGWVKASDVTVSSTEVTIHVFVAERELEVRQGDTVLLTTPIAVGADATPTPLGTFYVTDPQEFPNPDGVYGAYALGLSGFSEVLETFNGLPPQIAIHGTNQPDLLGQAVSNGCIRVANEAVLEIADAAGLGTPVIVSESRDQE